MKFQSLLSRKNMKTITNMLYAEFAQRVVKVKALITTAADYIIIIFCIFLQRKYGLTFHVNHLPSK